MDFNKSLSLLLKDNLTKNSIMVSAQLNFKKLISGIAIALLLLVLIVPSSQSQTKWDAQIETNLKTIISKHKALTSIPNVSTNEANMLKNVDWVQKEFEALGFSASLLASSTLPVLLLENEVSKKKKTMLFYLHVDGQDVNPAQWDQEDPFTPVLKEQDSKGEWNKIDWKLIEGKIDPEWRIFGRAVADDKGPIIMLSTALEMFKEQNKKLNFNIKIIIDLQEETSSAGFLETLEKYKSRYAADYFIIMDGPAHPTNQPTITFGCRGIATCSIRLYGPKLPQHSGHYGNYAPNPVFAMSHLLASMKDENGRVLIDGYYDGIKLSPETQQILENVPDDATAINQTLGINTPDKVGENYQESLQYPSFNVRQIETSWKGPKPKTIIPEIITAHIDVRLVKETDGQAQLDKIKKHIEQQGYLVLDRVPTDEERLNNAHIATFKSNAGINAFRTDLDSPLGLKIKSQIEIEFGQSPVLIRTMGGTVPITPAINALDIPAVIVPMVNMDNNQHNPNENIRIGNISQGVKICLAILSMKL